MKKVLILASLLALFSCSDEELLSPKDASSKGTASKTLELDLYELDTECLTLANAGNDPDGDNRECIQSQIDYAKANGYDGLSIGAIDCYVNVTFAANKSLQIPSEFALVMDPNTILRVTPNSAAGYALIDIGGSYDNNAFIHDSKIIGGQLMGDRLLHNNPTVHGHLLRIMSSYNLLIDGVSMREANCDGLYVSGKVISNQPNYSPPHDIVITNCRFDSNRRSNMSITDGYNIEVSYSDFQNAGNNMGTSLGQSPKLGLNIEGDRIWNNDHTDFIWFKHPHDIQVHHNTGSGNGSFYASLADHVEISYNVAHTVLGYVYGDNIRVAKNTISNAARGINAGFFSTTSTVNFANIVEENEVNDCGIGLNLFNTDTVVNSNTFNDCTAYAITFSHVRECQIINNNIFSSVSGSSGIKVSNNSFADDLEIAYNKIWVYGGSTSAAVNISNVNNASGQENYKWTIHGNDMRTDGHGKLAATVGATVRNNAFITQQGLTVSFSSAMLLSSNGITNNSSTANANALLLKDNTVSLVVDSNTIENTSTNANAHAVQVMDCSNLSVTGNTLIHGITRTLHMLNVTDSTITGNTGNVGSANLFVYGTGISNCTISNNNCIITPYTRQSINGAVTII